MSKVGRAAFPSGVLVRDAREALVGVRIICATGLASGVPHPDLASVYQVVNVTASTVIVAPVVNSAIGGEPDRLQPRLERKRSVAIATGVSRHKYPSDVVIFMHTGHLARLHALLGFDGSQAWRRP